MPSQITHVWALYYATPDGPQALEGLNHSTEGAQQRAETSAGRSLEWTTDHRAKLPSGAEWVVKMWTVGP